MTSTFGAAVNLILSNLTGALPGALSILFFVLGIYMVFAGLWGLANNYGDRGGATPVKGAITLVLGGAALTSLVALFDTGLSTVFGTVGYYTGAQVAVGTPTNCLATSSGSGNGGQLDCILHNVGINLIPVAVETLFVACMLVGYATVGALIYKLAMSSRRPGVEPPRHWGLKLFGAVLLGNFPWLVNLLSITMGYQPLTDNSGYHGVQGGAASSILSYAGPSSGKLAQLSGVITWGCVIVSGFGLFYTAQGIFMLMSPDVHPNRGKAYAHIFFGVLMANIYETARFITNMMGMSVL